MSKVLGEYDLALISSTNSVSFPVNLPVLSSTTYTLLGLTGPYESPDLGQWLADAPLCMFMQLEFDKLLYSKGSISSIAHHFVDTYQSRKDKSKWADIAFYGGLGHAELLAVAKSGDIEPLMKTIHELRAIQYGDVHPAGFENDDDDALLPMLATTQSTPLVSYENVILNKNYESLRGEAHAIISITSPPGLEAAIADDLGVKDAGHWITIGEKDVVVVTEKDVEMSELVEKVIEFRRNVGPKVSSGMTTTTQILCQSFGSVEPSSTYKLLHDFDFEIEQRFSDLQPTVADRIDRLAARLKETFNSRRHYIVASDFRIFADRIRLEISDYIACEDRKKREQATDTLATIVQWSEQAEIALAQRIHSPATPQTAIAFNREDSLAPLLGMRYIIDYIFECWSELDIGDDDMRVAWQGFVYFSDTSYFSMYAGEVISIPHDAAQFPFLPSKNWLPLTHEISHILHSRLDSFADNRGRLHEMLDIRPDAMSPFEREGSRYHDRNLSEVIATWFDYYHFYDADYEYFFKYLWLSLLSLPGIRRRISNYHIRTFLLTCMRDEAEFRSAIVSGMEAEYYGEKWQTYLGEVEDFSKQTGQSIPLDEWVGESTIVGARVLGRPALDFVSNNKLEKFRSSVNKAYENLDAHVDSIMNGRIVHDEIENPLLLLRKCYEKSSLVSTEVRDIHSTAFVLSLRNSQRFVSDD